MPKPNKQIQIDFIINCLKNGEQRGNILVKAGKKWGMSKSAFDRYLKIAKDQYSITQGLLKKELAAIDTSAAIEARKKAIMTADDRKEELSKACLDLIQKTKGEKKFTFFQAGKIVQSHNGEIFMLPIDTQAKILDTVKGLIAELNKMEGDYAPTKIETDITFTVEVKED